MYVMLLLPTTSHSNTSCVSIPLPHFTNNNIEKKGNKLKKTVSTRHENSGGWLYLSHLLLAGCFWGCGIFANGGNVYKIKQTDNNGNFFIN